MIMNRLSMILNSIEGITMVDFNLLLEDTVFRKNFLEWFNVDKLDDKKIISNSVEYINNNF